MIKSVLSLILLLFPVMLAAQVQKGDQQQTQVQVSEDEIISRSLDAVKKLQAVRYDGKLFRIHDEESTETAWGGVLLTREPHVKSLTGVPGRFRMNATTVELGDTVYQEYLSMDGTYLIRNPAKQTVVNVNSPYSVGMLSGSANQLLVTRLVSEAVLERMLGEPWEVAGTESVGGIPCHLLRLETEQMRGGQPFPVLQEIWIGVQDHLVRRFRFNSILTEIRNLEILERIPETDLSFRDDDSYIYTTFDLSRDRNPLAENNLLAFGSQAPDWELSDFDGRSYRLSDYRNRLLLIDFWATWCGPCKNAVPVLNDLYREYRQQGLDVIGINTWEEVSNPDFLRSFVKEGGYQYPVVLNGDDTAREYRVFGLPTFYLIGREGQVLYADYGAPPTLNVKLRTVIGESLSRGE